MGAEVIKIESLSGDESRQNGPTVRGQSAYWVQYNSGKKSLSINLRTDEGKEVLKDLVKVSDILLQNFRPGTIEKMGFGYDQLKKLNPGIVMLNISAYGQYGPYAERVGFDPIGQALGGMMSLNGFPDGPPIKTTFPLIDRITSLHATIGALAALREREFSGEGQSIDVSLADTGFTANEIPISAYLGDGIETAKQGNGKGTAGTYQANDGWVILAATNDPIWERVCDVIQKPEWKTDDRFTHRSLRASNYLVIEETLNKWFSNKTMTEAVDILSKNSIPCSPVNNVAQASNDPHLREREMMVEVPDPVAGTMWVTGKSIKFSRTPMVVGATPKVGEHTNVILSGVLGYSKDEIQQLVEKEVIRIA